MYLTRNLRFIALIITLAVTTVIGAQVPVEVSGEKIVSGGKIYYLHEVQKNQTLYSISKAYRVTVDAITRENVIPPNGIQTGQVLRVPVADQQAVAASQPRSSAQQPSPASVNRPVGQPSPKSANNPAQPSRQAMMSDVPGISISTEKTVSGGKTYFMHEVQKGQTLYSIAKAYKVTILDIDRENSIPAGGIREGQVLKIPASSALVVTNEDIPAAEPAVTGANATTTTPPAGRAAQGQKTQMPRQEPPATKPDTPGQAADGTVTFKADEVKENTVPKTPAETNTRTETATRQQAQQQTPAPGSTEDKPKPVQPEKKKIHKVQKGESLADIAKKYGITVQELKQANKGVIFAMPDMRLVIPVKEE
ncbi:MAG: LysM peptidoglycan-binding domain-containing protein [Actinomycetota bacterium]|jgi:LysM repeat protein